MNELLDRIFIRSKYGILYAGLFAGGLGLAIPLGVVGLIYWLGGN